MNKFIELLSDKLKKAFADSGYDESYGKVTVSNRPDLCEYQCNGAMAAAKAYKKAPFMIADDVVAKLQGDEAFLEVTSVKPGFINLKVNPAYLSNYLNEMSEDDKLGCANLGQNKKMIIDYGGPNVAKPLHVGHLRSAVIGESIKRIGRYVGWDVIGDAHLGDWGLQMGLIIEEFRTRNPESIYFDENFTGPYPKEAPFTIAQLEEIYPTASGKSKVDKDYAKRAHDATVYLQQGRPGYRALWQHILNVSIADLKKNYSFLNVEFDLWKKESDAQPYIPAMVEMMKEKGFAHESEGALVVDVKEETDTKEIPPCIIVKSDGATLYSTTDLATLVEREKLFDPAYVLYVVDKRQEMHFKQVFRCAKKTGIVKSETKLQFLGFGTMNGKDGKPFKTRDGGVMRLEVLLKEITEAVYQKTMDNRTVTKEEAMETAKMIALAAIKYGDLSNQASKDYVFDVDRFTSFEGDTGPYILYTIVRIKSILNKCEDKEFSQLNEAGSESEKALQLVLTRVAECIENAFIETAPHKICAYIYEVSNAFNKFYHETKILAETDKEKQAGYLALLSLTRKVLETCVDLLGFEAPERM